MSGDEGIVPRAFQSDNRTSFIDMSNEGVPQLQEGENRMSSLSRRACYKCGNVGHYAGMPETFAHGNPILTVDLQRSVPRRKDSATIVRHIHGQAHLAIANFRPTGKQPGTPKI